MKHCPKCDLSFSDFHHVCDFDGTDLVSELEDEPKQVRQRPRLRRLLRSPFFLAGLAAPALLSSALLIGYLDANSQSVPVAKERPSPTPSVSMVPVARVTEKRTVQTKTPAPEKRDQDVKRAQR
jgi:hypothetical protein